MKHACHKASALASDSLDRQLTLTERLSLRLHLFICKNCQNHDHNLHLIREIGALLREADYGKIDLSEDQRLRLHQALDQKL